MKAVYDAAGSVAALAAERSTRVGFLHPSRSVPDDLLFWSAALGPAVTVEAEHAVLPGYIHGLQGLRALADPKVLTPAAQALAARRVDAIVWACTSGSFVLGSRGARCRMRTLSQCVGVPATSTALAFAAAARALGLRRVAVAASYPSTVTALFESFLSDEGIEALQLMHLDVAAATPGAGCTPERLYALAAADHPRAHALLIPDDALAGAGQVPVLEAALGKPVLTAGEVTAWAGALLAGVRPAGPGRLFGAAAPSDYRALFA